jgi:hypothetical protein
MRALACLLLSVGSVAFAAPKALEPGPFSSLPLYQGTWQVSRNGSGAKPDTLVNQCAALGSYYTCAQNVNGQSMGLLVFIPKGVANHFFTQVIKPDGRATGRDELEIEGDVWTYRSRRDENGKTTYFRTTNTFSGKNKIHFESAHSSNGNDWTTDMSGDDVRAAH